MTNDIILNATTNHGAIKIEGSDSLRLNLIMRNCHFHQWKLLRSLITIDSASLYAKNLSFDQDNQD